MANCTNGLYVSPTMGSTVDSLSQPLNVAWDTSCLSCKEIDIYLYAPNSALPRIHVWEHVALSRGSYPAQLMPRWWNSTQSQQLQIIIVPAGDPPFMSTFPAGPVFTATYSSNSSSTPAAADTSIIDSGVTRVNDLATQQASKKALSGRAAAGVLIPLIFIALAVFAYIKWKRRSQEQKRKAWTEKVDKRMSTISTEWKSVSAAGAQAAIRNSMAAAASRNSSFSFGAIRPDSSLDTDPAASYEKRDPTMRSGTGVGLRNPNALSSAASGRNSTTSTRVSRVSFAPDPRVSRVSFAESTDSSRKNVPSRAFHSAYVPPVPALPDGITSIYIPDKSDKDKDNLSPRQTAGPLTLTQDDIKARIGASASGRHNKGSMSGLDAEMMPALSLMRTGNMESSETDDFLLPPAGSQMLQVPEMSYSPTTPSITASFPIPPKMAAPSVVLSPDEMLRAYAERKKSLADAARAGRIGAPLRASVVPSIAGSAATSLSSPSTTTTSGSFGMGTGKVETVSSIHATGMRVAYNNNNNNGGMSGLALPAPSAVPAGYDVPQTKTILPLSLSGKKGIEGGKALLGKVKSIGKKRKSMNPFVKSEPHPAPEASAEVGEEQFENPGEAYVAALEAEAAETDAERQLNAAHNLGDDVVGAYPYAFDEQQQQQEQYYGQYPGYEGQYYGYGYGEQSDGVYGYESGNGSGNVEGGEEGLAPGGQAYGY